MNFSQSLRASLALGGGWVAVGLLLQAVAGPVDWDALAFPVNLAVGGAWLLLIGVLHVLRRRGLLPAGCCDGAAAVGALAWVVGLTLVMGLTRQVAAGQPPVDAMGFSQMLTNWAFVLVYAWTTLLLGLTVLHRAARFARRDLSFLGCHLGLFVVLTGGALGSADVQRLRLTAARPPAAPEYRAVAADGRVQPLDWGLRLRRFRLETYPPRLWVCSSRTGQPQPAGAPEALSLDGAAPTRRLTEWTVRVVRHLSSAAPAPAPAAPLAAYRSWTGEGACAAAYVEAERNGLRRAGWVSEGSFLFPPAVLRLDGASVLAMPERTPRRFVADVTVYRSSGDSLTAEVEVNRPLAVGGWDIYLTDYDRERGAWSDIAVFELVRDPWLPVVYGGIALLLLGALGLLFFSKPSSSE